jgi:hypothetical protein
MNHTDSGRRGYKSLVAVLKKERRGLTAADMAAKTALPLHSVRELVSAAADEYGARLKVTESGEILYSFPGGFASRYRGPAARARRYAETILEGLSRFFRAAFKVWITVMLAGYFVLFVLITLAALVFIMAASASSNGRGGRRNSGGFGSAFLLSRMLNLIVRFWFYSSLLGQNRGAGSAGRAGQTNKDQRPLFKKVFSFVFGDGDPNEGRERSENEELIAYLRKNRGVISLPEFMIHTGLDPQRADREILAFCAKYGGMPEATEDGTVVYRFDSMLLSAQAAASRTDRTLKRLWKFSENARKDNTAFAAINGVNLAFGAYFLFFILNLGTLIAGRNIAGSTLFIFVYNVLAGLGINPLFPVFWGLGMVPFLFSVFFWAVPAIRAARLKAKNAAINRENRRRLCFAGIWDKPLEVSGADEEFIKEIGAYSVPDVSVDSRGETVYSFTGIEREKKALESYRASLDAARGELGGVVFDSGA